MQMKRIIVRMPNWIGDFVMATPVLEDIRKRYPDASITVLCAAGLEQLLDGNPFIDDIISFSRKRRFFPLTKEGRCLLYQLQKTKYDVGILLTYTFSSAWLFFAGRVKKRIGFYQKCRKLLVNENVPYPENRATQHLVLTYKDLLKPLGIERGNSAPRLFIKPAMKPIGRTVIGINPGAAYGSAKCWLPDRFRGVIEALIKDIPGVQILIFGDKKTTPLVNEVCKGFGKEVVNLAGKTTLMEFISQIASLDVLLTNDSGPMHVGAAYQIPLVALFGSTNDIATGPYKCGEVIHKRVSCSPCYKRVCPIDFKCMKRIEVSEVVEAINRQIVVGIEKERALPFSFEGAVRPKVVKSIKKSIEKNSVGSIILAAGAGQRLGLSVPKGCLEVKGKALYEHLLEKRKGPVAIMTSPVTHKGTEEFLRKKGLLDEVELFQTRTLLKKGKGRGVSPEGNGALFGAFYASPIWEKWKEIDTFVVVPVDNPLADPFDKELSSAKEELAVRAVALESAHEKMGILVEKEERLDVCEYLDVPGEERGSWNLGYTGIFSCSRNFFKKAAFHNLPWHRIEREGSVHYERFVFDSFPIAKDYTVLISERKKFFAPIKNKEDLAKMELV